MTQAELAAKVDVGQQAVSKWERGITLPTNKKVMEIEVALGLAPQTLLHYAWSAVSENPTLRQDDSDAPVAEPAESDDMAELAAMWGEIPADDRRRLLELAERLRRRPRRRR
jgi:transcriptional regulator with XRE-family HTH domain